MMEINRITKFYGKRTGILNLSFSVNEGEILGIAGPNASGKTTIFRIMANLLKPNSGEILFNGLDIQLLGINFRDQLGYMPEDAGHYLRMTALENLYFHVAFYKRPVCKKTIEKFLNQFDLYDVRHLSVGKYSKGMKQRLLFIKTILHNPAIYLFDEPFNALDPLARSIGKDLIRKFRQEGKMIILSSHSLADLDELCDYILLLKNGRQVFYEKTAIFHTLSAKDKGNDIESAYRSSMSSI